MGLTVSFPGIHILSGEIYDEDKGKTTKHWSEARRIIDRSPKLRLWFIYPLTKSVIYEVTGDGSPWTQKQFYREVRDCYVEIYKDEGEPPPHTDDDLLLNRKKSDGPYGIWGHDLDDLYLEGAEFDEEHQAWIVYCGS